MIEWVLTKRANSSGGGVPADLPHPHVGCGGVEGFAEELADLVGVRSDLCQVVEEQQDGGEGEDAGEKTQIPKLHQELDVFSKQALRENRTASLRPAASLL